MIKLALPAGDLRAPLANLLSAAGLHVQGYGEGSRAYRLSVGGRPDVAVRVFREKDIPIQVALGNYDLGICSLAWVREIQARFPGQPVLPVCDLGVGSSLLCAAGTPGLGGLTGLPRLPIVRIATEYPNLADAFARAARLPRFRIQAVWGGAEAYPPEDADVALTVVPSESAISGLGLDLLFVMLRNSAWLVANAAALASKDVASVVAPLAALARGRGRSDGVALPPPLPAAGGGPAHRAARRIVRMAVPDGHQQRHAVAALRAAGLSFAGYDESRCERRPASGIEGLEVKVLRPQDMPQLLAFGEIDLAITGRDCLREHLYSFPSSPVEEVLDLQRGQYNLCAVVSQGVEADSIGDVLALWRESAKGIIRLASEFPATADHYARSRHFWRYQIIPIAGASEGFVPEDADILIEGTETGRTLAENNLKAIDLLFRSTTCVIARKDAQLEGPRRRVFQDVISALEKAAKATEGV